METHELIEEAKDLIEMAEVAEQNEHEATARVYLTELLDLLKEELGG